MRGIGDGVEPGHTLGRYELLVPIARGGMAVVWAARMKGTRGFQKLVAIKSMLPSLTDDDGTFEEMFLDEAQLAAQIRHPNVCEVLDLGEQDGVLFIVMEWVDGEPLGTIHKIARERGLAIPIAITTRIGLSVAQGLHAAHEMKNQETGAPYGLVHRDVSPQNILITHDGVVKVVDFGVAKATSGAAMNKTAVGQMKGKVTYMAPEQARGDPIDRRADVFALGICLYQLVTNRHPFKGDTPLKTLDRICDAKPCVAPITYTPTCHPALSAAIVKALEKDPKKRFATMLEFAHALEGVLSKMVTRGNDLAPFVKELVGDRNEKRRELIREALRTADERKPDGVALAPVESPSGLKRALAAPTAAGLSIDETGRTPGASSFSAPSGDISSSGGARRPSPVTPAEPRRQADTLDETESHRATAARATQETQPSSEPPAPVPSEPPAPVPSEPPPSEPKLLTDKASTLAKYASTAPPKGPVSSSRPSRISEAPPSEPRRSRAWIVGALVVLVAAIGVVAFTVPGALERMTPGRELPPPPLERPEPTSAAPSASASASASAAPEGSATAAASDSAAPAASSAAPDADGSAEPASASASASATASATAPVRPGMGRPLPYSRPRPPPAPTPLPPALDPL